MKKPARYNAGERAWSHSRNAFSRQRNHSLDKQIDEKDEDPAVKIQRRKAISTIQRDSVDKEWAIRRSMGSFSVGTQHYEKVIIAPAKLTKRGEES